MKILCISEGGVTLVFEPDDVCDEEGVGQVRKEMSAFLDEHPSDSVTFDFSSVSREQTNSSLVGTLISYRRNGKSGSRHLYLIHPPRSLTEALEATGLKTFFQVEEAVLV
ncbi:MAG: STAS domain-containing protein [Candidatus Andersenbacteria bacterium]|nr:STAS domain-containing protein [Candidatus Andersenbacteria bacterium]MBI3250712.1 STAS domain-containing protein [Candidatus Andersenbacteria bacterium]